MTLVFEFPVKKISRKKGSTASQHLITLYNHVENATSFRDPIFFYVSHVLPSYKKSKAYICHLLQTK